MTDQGVSGKWDTPSLPTKTGTYRLTIKELGRRLRSGAGIALNNAPYRVK